jgi:hypothetical protein
MSPALWFIAIGIPAWAALMLSAVYLDAKLGGWHSLASKYPCDPKRKSDGRKWRGRTISLANGGSGHHGMVTVTANQQGMMLQMMIVVRWFYPNMFLPWKDVAAVRERGLIWDRVHLTFSAVPDVPVTIHASLADEILATVGRVWQEPKVSEVAPLSRT